MSVPKARVNSGIIVSNAAVRLGGGLGAGGFGDFGPTETEFFGGAQSILGGTGFSYQNLRLSGTGVKSLDADFSITGDLTLQLGVADPGVA